MILWLGNRASFLSKATIPEHETWQRAVNIPTSRMNEKEEGSVAVGEREIMGIFY